MKNNYNAALTRRANEAAKRPVFYYQPCSVNVGNVSVTGRSVKECKELAKVAQVLSKATPSNVKCGPIAVSGGPMTDSAKLVNAVKELAEATPPSFMFMGMSVKAGTVGKALLGIGGVTIVICAGDFVKKWIKKKIAKPTGQDSGNDSGNDEIEPMDQSVNEIRNELTSTNLDDGQLVGKLIYQGDKAIIFSEPGTGKTTLTMGIALDIAQGRVSRIVPSDDGVHASQDVFFYDGENDEEDYKKIFGDHAVETERLHFIRKFYFKDTTSWLNDLRKRLNGVKGNVTIVLDNISCILHTHNPNLIRELFLKEFAKIQSDYVSGKVTFIIVAHTNKQKDLMGSANQTNFATSVLKLSSKDERYLQLEVIKNRKYGEMTGQVFLLAKCETQDGFKYDEYAGGSVPRNGGKRPSKSSRIPPETKQEMKDFYQKGVPEHGYKSIIKKFELDARYGITDPKEVSRILESL